jgi:hypothetical protein
VRDLADHFALIDIEVERDAHVLQVVIAAWRVRPIRPRNRAQQYGRTKNRGRQGHVWTHFFPAQFHSSLAREFAARKTIQPLYPHAPRGIRASFSILVVRRAPGRRVIRDCGKNAPIIIPSSAGERQERREKSLFDLKRRKERFFGAQRTSE